MGISEKIFMILAELSGEDTIIETNSLQNDLALDSLAMVTLLVEIEEIFNIELNESDMNPYDLITVQDVIDLVNKYCGDKNE